MTPDEMREWLAERPRVMDGATASELLRRGVAAAARLWGVGALLEAPDAVRGLHRDYAAAGAEALTAATFRVAPYSLRGADLETRASELAALAVRLAREGSRDAGREALVLTSQATLEDCYRPDLVPDDETLRREHAATAALLAAAGPDALLLETFNTVREARIAAEAAAATGLPVLVSFACTAGGHLLSGEDVRDAAVAVSVPGVAAVGVNCTAVQVLSSGLGRIAEVTRLPLIAYANNAWHADDAPWLAAVPLCPERYAACALAWAAAGARLVGGCCGTSPEHIAAVAALLQR
ncbi:MAG: homocysteine S-methyltransferase family protein [Thermoanaerobaculaceae bacterium]|jgi:S-methylmethionine-dependent homocysteine/selenocysteine methylase